MRRFVLSLAVVLGLAAPAAAQGTGIEATIRAQIDAFLTDDAGRAFDYASPAIRNVFRTPENFAAMVREGYPMVWRPSDLRFLGRREDGGALWQRVLITDAAGEVHVLDYQMITSENGWKINAVMIVPPPDVNA